MKKLLIIIFLFLGLICRVSATEKSIDTLSKIENSILGIDYSNQKTEKRLDRIEEYVYGHKNTGNNNTRLQKLAKDLNADVIGQEIEPCENTIQTEPEEIVDNSVDYPILDDVEKKLSLKSNKNQTLHSRLVAIEQNMFKKVFDTDDFYTRVERIKNKMYGNKDYIAENDDDNTISIPEMIPDTFDDSDFAPKHNFYNKCKNKNCEYKLSILEQKVLNNTFPDENNNDRLARLENCVFDTEFYYDNEQDRIDRLESAVKAKKTANRYDNNKFQQRLNAALQIGTMVLMVLAFIL